MKIGDEILEVDGYTAGRWGGMSGDSITWRILRSEGATIPIKVKRGDQEVALEVTPQIPPTKWWQRRGLRQILIGPADTPMIAKVKPGSWAALAGLKPSDIITEVNGQRLYGAEGIELYAKNHPTDPLTLTVRRGTQVLAVPVKLPVTTVDTVMPDSPAELAGLKPGDRIIGLNGQPQYMIEGILEFVARNSKKPVELEIERGTEKIKMKVTPVAPAGVDQPLLGFTWVQDNAITWDQMGVSRVINPTPSEQIRASVMMVVDTVGAIFSSKSNIGFQHMGGPVMMMRAYYVMFENPEGWRLALWFSVVLNVNLGMLNMLPLPVLDGGHITLALIEGARRRPLNARFLEFVQTGFALVIISFMVFIMFFDVQDWVGGGARAQQLKFDRAKVVEAQQKS
jgi:membrane-associated protease RseP (regulator of RpoE activity)